MLSKLPRHYWQFSHFTVLCTLFVLLFSCEVQEGPGGLGSITGRVYAHDYSADFSQFEGAYYEPKEDVFLVYGDDEIYSDDMETHHDGSFKFEFLRKGTYKVYVYSKDSTGTIPAGVYPVVAEVEISSRNQQVDVGEMVIVK